MGQLQRVQGVINGDVRRGGEEGGGRERGRGERGGRGGGKQKYI